MSIQAVGAVLATRMDSSRNKFVLLVLANYANDDGWAWPKQDTIAANASLRRETVNVALAELEKQGYIRSEQTYRDDGSKSHKRYFLRFLYGDPDTGAPEPDVRNTHIADVSKTNSKNRHSPSSPLPLSLKKEGKGISVDSRARAREEVPNEIREVIDAYNEHRGVLPRIVGLRSWRKPIERLIKAWPSVRDDLLADPSVKHMVAEHSLADVVRLALTKVDKANYKQNSWDLGNLIAGKPGDPMPKLFGYYKKALVSQSVAKPASRPNLKPGVVVRWMEDLGNRKEQRLAVIRSVEGDAVALSRIREQGSELHAYVEPDFRRYAPGLEVVADPPEFNESSFVEEQAERQRDLKARGLA